MFLFNSIIIIIVLQVLSLPWHYSQLTAPSSACWSLLRSLSDLVFGYKSTMWLVSVHVDCVPMLCADSAQHRP